MKKFGFFLLWLVGVAVFLLATAHFTLRHLLNTPDFKKTVTEFITRATGRAADYGRIDYQLFPFALRVQNAVLKEADGQQDFASIQSFTAEVDFRRKEVTSVTLDRPVVRIVQQADGSYNFTDIGRGKPATTKERSAAESETGAEPTSAAAAPLLVIGRIDLRQARVEFIRRATNGAEHKLVLSAMDGELTDFATANPLHFSGRMAIGEHSTLEFALSGPPPADHSAQPIAWPLDLTARMEIGDVADIQALLPEAEFPFSGLTVALHAQGSLADRLAVEVTADTPITAPGVPSAIHAKLTADLLLPAPVADHLLLGAALPDAFKYNPPPCAAPPGTVALGESPLLALLLRHLQAQAQLTFTDLTLGANALGDGAANLLLHEGVLTIPTFTFAAHGGRVTIRGAVQLLACPLAYQLTSLQADGLMLHNLLAANMEYAPPGLDGTVQLTASAHGHAVGEEALPSLVADLDLQLTDLRNVGEGGSLADQMWRQLDQPLLLRLLPTLKAKVAAAKQTANLVTTNRYEDATAKLALRNGRIAVSSARLAAADYRLNLHGVILPFADQLDLQATVRASPEETAQLTGGKDLSAFLPYEDGGLQVPLFIRGPLRKPVVVPDMDTLLKNAAAGLTSQSDGGNILDSLSASDRKNVEKGLAILNDLLQQ
jgi:hypothetical protein